MLLHENLKAEQFLLRFEKTASQTERLMTQDPDTALYTLIQSIAGGVADYSSNHALLSGVICRMASPRPWAGATPSSGSSSAPR